ncbi:hypothetical protein SAMD00019534_097390 [Acytostelium subglobosum LB1]|uniref:hypothetical protein n=1 Tax=Acytostelium subglobosum LB1 TaxID=1410327 RepID=UPI000644E478|nr:hypothetical protein SAMD00019534_097390 [Acytostelium subglobosum LB1]GAM26564.1 hypothetical protein SAMD00019534_097390 [Acytostelium subglobosum LB1]|eukprot:XP_012750660.1 hypothetical protein SAMD00019534_097390 [Acytostelium subglobosum LB1]
MINRLPDDVAQAIRSTLSIVSYEQALEEVVYNAIDACSHTIFVNVNLTQWSFDVKDDGNAIVYEDLKLIGSRNCTSKLNSTEDLAHLATFGFRGESLASIGLISALEIVTTPRETNQTCSKLIRFGNEEEVKQLDSLKDYGTLVKVRDLFRFVPVRRQSINFSTLRQSVRKRMEIIALSHPHISITLFEESKGPLITPSMMPHERNSFLSLFSKFYGPDKADMMELVETDGRTSDFKIKGYCSIPTKKGHPNQSLQFVFINQRVVLATKIHRQINQLYKDFRMFNGQKMAQMNGGKIRREVIDVYPLFVLFIECPFTEYERSYDPSGRTFLEFKNWNIPTDLIRSALTRFLTKNRVDTVSHNTSNEELLDKQSMLLENSDNDHDHDGDRDGHALSDSEGVSHDHMGGGFDMDVDDNVGNLSGSTHHSDDEDEAMPLEPVPLSQLSQASDIRPLSILSTHSVLVKHQPQANIVANSTPSSSTGADGNINNMSDDGDAMDSQHSHSIIDSGSVGSVPPSPATPNSHLKQQHQHQSSQEDIKVKDEPVYDIGPRLYSEVEELEECTTETLVNEVIDVDSLDIKTITTVIKTMTNKKVVSKPLDLTLTPPPAPLTQVKMEMDSSVDESHNHSGGGLNSTPSPKSKSPKRSHIDSDILFNDSPPHSPPMFSTSDRSPSPAPDSGGDPGWPSINTGWPSTDPSWSFGGMSPITQRSPGGAGGLLLKKTSPSPNKKQRSKYFDNGPTTTTSPHFDVVGGGGASSKFFKSPSQSTPPPPASTQPALKQQSITSILATTYPSTPSTPTTPTASTIPTTPTTPISPTVKIQDQYQPKVADNDNTATSTASPIGVSKHAKSPKSLRFASIEKVRPFNRDDIAIKSELVKSEDQKMSPFVPNSSENPIALDGEEDIIDLEWVPDQEFEEHDSSFCDDVHHHHDTIMTPIEQDEDDSTEEEGESPSQPQSQPLSNMSSPSQSVSSTPSIMSFTYSPNSGINNSNDGGMPALPTTPQIMMSAPLFELRPVVQLEDGTRLSPYFDRSPEGHDQEAKERIAREYQEKARRMKERSEAVRKIMERLRKDGDRVARSHLDDVRFIAQVDKKFLLCASKGLLFVLDQHAVSERIKLEYYTKLDPEFDTQTMPHGTRWSLTPDEMHTLASHKSAIEKYGFRWQSHKSTITVETVPKVCSQSLNVDHLHEFLSALSDRVVNAPPAFHRIRQTHACTRAIKFGHKVTNERAVTLLKELSKCGDPFHCAHGRPSSVSLVDFGKLSQSIKDIEQLVG